MSRTCDSCGESFGTLTRLRLHDCPNESSLVDEAFLPKPDPDKMPNAILDRAQFEGLKNDARIDRVENMLNVPLPGDHKAISIVVEVDGFAYGLHCDHETSEWDIITEGDDFDEVKEEHMQWVSRDIENVSGGPLDSEFSDSIEVPDQITKECEICGGEHVLTAQPGSFPSTMGLMEYEGICEESGHPIIVTESPDELVK